MGNGLTTRDGFSRKTFSSRISATENPVSSRKHADRLVRIRDTCILQYIRHTLMGPGCIQRDIYAPRFQYTDYGRHSVDGIIQEDAYNIAYIQSADSQKPAMALERWSSCAYVQFWLPSETAVFCGKLSTDSRNMSTTVLSGTACIPSR